MLERSKASQGVHINVCVISQRLVRTGVRAIIHNMRKALLVPVALASACAFSPVHPSATPPSHPAEAPVEVSATTGPTAGISPVDEARLLFLEDRREFDANAAREWLSSPNPLRRTRMARFLAHVGPQTFVDDNHNGQRDPGERQAGVALLTPLVSDPDRNVREMAAFALGEIGDPAAVDALVQFASDPNDAAVAAEAVEALSKLAAHVPLARYSPFATEGQRDGVRVRAIRYLFRFNSDEASAIAADLLQSPGAPIREAAAYALSRRAYAPARARLELLLSDASPSIRAYAVAALGRIAAAESLPALVSALRDSFPWVRTNAAVAIARIAAKNPTSIEGPSLAPNALRISDTTGDPDPGTRASAIDTLGWYATRSDSARNRLFEIAANGSRWERELAAGAIARHFGDTTPSAVDDLIASATPWAKVRIAEASAELPRTGASIRKRLAADGDVLVRENAISSIPDASVDAEMDVIRAGMDDADVIVRANAIDRYSHSKSADAATLLAAESRAHSDAQNDARLAAITALAAIDFPDREKTLRGFLGDRDPVVRRVTADLIEEKLKLPRPQYTPLPIDRPLADYVRIIEWSRRPHTARIHMTRGDIDLALVSLDAPMTAWNFAELAEKHYFDNTTFMRVVPNFVIQGGDPRNDMNGGPGYAIRDEINLQKYTRGAVGMALSGPDTGGSQFFITHSPQPHLDGGYTIFGRVTEGMTGVVDQVERGDRVETITIDR